MIGADAIAAGRGGGHADGQPHRLGLEQQHDGGRRRQRPADRLGRRMRWNNVGADYFRVLGTPMLLGRDFTDADLLGARPTVIVNDAFARAYLPNRPSDRAHASRCRPRPGARQFMIIGVAANSRYTGVRESSGRWPTSCTRRCRRRRSMHIEVRASGDPARPAPDIRRIVAELGPDLPL